MAGTKTLGIMAICNGPHFLEKAYYKKLTLIGRKLGIRVFVFSPRHVDFEARQVTGFAYRQGIWQRKTFPLPQVIYDRVFIGPHYRQYKPFIEKLQNDPEITFLGRGLSGKWQVYKILSQSPELEKWLPETHPFSFVRLRDMLERYDAAVIKPMAGTHGRSVIRIAKSENKYEVSGRDRQNQPMQKIFKTSRGMQLFLKNFTAGRKFLLQPYLHLHTPDGTPFDVRVLVQKNGIGQWQTTGKAVRAGDKTSITSNLHGGGRALPLSDFLAEYYTEEQQQAIEEELDQIIEQLPPFLEEYHGRLVELGIDIGIDTDGQVWIIEVNSKPGRTVFRQINDQKARLRSLTQPVSYAHYLMKEHVGGYQAWNL
ncbi:YheC/YheD family protein [Brevibacillus fulvus]|uniref:ATP-grasp domain-containing protein n=1 Tax=Brevibacillus fulvus TaxID=1125967 RepID=A0A938Y2Q7_9BACL|nr:YheC/YheD family protein [Brevibacillus fulvus]MBM7591299.1 hypothetical protein [Brevibacillus fulvus]